MHDDQRHTTDNEHCREVSVDAVEAQNDKAADTAPRIGPVSNRLPRRPLPAHLPGILLVAACWRSTTPPATPPVENHGAHTPSPLEITLSRTPCFGTCPVYTVTIHGDGRVDWLGTDYVDVTGARHARISQAQLDKLAATIDRIGFFGLDDRGAPPADPMADVIICSDTPHAVVTVERGGQRHTTDNDHCTAVPVDALEEQIDAAAQTSEWIGAGHL